MSDIWRAVTYENENLMKHLKYESIALFVLMLLATVIFWKEMNWVHYLVLFWIIDIIGYWPGVIFSKILKTNTPPTIFYHTYNFMHNYGTVALIGLIYASVSSTPYSALSLFLHLSIDRGILGNFLKKKSYEFHIGGLQSND